MIAVIVDEGIRRMYKRAKASFIITVMNEPYVMPHMPGDEGRIKKSNKASASNKKAELGAVAGQRRDFGEVLQRRNCRKRTTAWRGRVGDELQRPVCGRD
jgi:hypothetical protein